MDQIFDILGSLLEPVAILLAVIILLRINSWIFKRIKSLETNGNIVKNSISFLLILLGALVFILSLPLENTLKGQILTFLGIIISAGIALSSTTLLGNLIAGIMNNSMKRFRSGDLIKIEDLQGRVIKKSIFHTEIQLEDSNFITIPNLYIANNPVKLTRKTNTVISTAVSLGYDIPRTEIEEALKEAALATGLKDPYVYITKLGDYSAVYKIHGFLDDSSNFFSTNSLLNSKVMDKLHERKIEIVSPTFMNQRRVEEKKFIPRKIIETTISDNSPSPEDLIFDQAIKSEKIEEKKDYIREMDDKIKSLKERLKETDNRDEVKKIRAIISRNEDLKEKIERNIREQVDQNEESSK